MDSTSLVYSDPMAASRANDNHPPMAGVLRPVGHVVDYAVNRPLYAIAKHAPTSSAMRPRRFRMSTHNADGPAPSTSPAGIRLRGRGSGSPRHCRSASSSPFRVCSGPQRNTVLGEGIDPAMHRRLSLLPALLTPPSPCGRGAKPLTTPRAPLPPSESDLDLLKSPNSATPAGCSKLLDKHPGIAPKARAWGSGQEIKFWRAESLKGEESYFFDEDGTLVGTMFLFRSGLDLAADKPLGIPCPG